ncbi:AraC family transcriptional regulator [Solimonas marina]|uniref:AraC family transcriptional regulator n=1 Tax=Solimonas marina TaxID=2714601 RepID=A0A970B7R7_9GAMM|nr:AraC family transcriptional regulator [Solimonas marina]NKF21504.1 AraC family transcriptional regulator [Solimonas marina]
MRDSGYFLEVIHSGMVTAGLNVNAIYERLGYNAEELPLREMRTPHQLQAYFWETVEAVTGDPEIGLHLCPHLPVFHGEVLEYLIFSSATLGEGLERALKYLRLLSDALNVRIVTDDEGARALIKGTAAEAPQLRHTEICIVFELIQFLKSVTEGRFAPQRVALHCSQRAPQAEYEKIFGCPVSFGAPESELWFDPAVLEYRSPRWDPDLLKLHEDLAERRLSKLRRHDLIERIQKLFAQRLELDQLTLEDVAAELDVPTRRLRFELSRAGTSFSELLADFRFALAKRLLAGTEESIENIVYLTGFSEPSTFYRAFKRWSSMTPVQYREQKRSHRRLARASGP